MKNVEIVDGALNSRFEIYGVEGEVFDRLFPSGQDEVYLEDLDAALQDDVAFWERVYAHEVDRQSVQGIHGILHTHPRAKVSILEISQT
ncbi:MAG: hypothetical protein O7G87_06540 [bacterium]|nr:hypothetical protein [bacterium]